MSKIEFCPFCGRKQKENAGFCTVCGKPLPKKASEFLRSNPDPKYSYQQQPQNINLVTPNLNVTVETNKKVRRSIAFIPYLFIIAGIALSFFFLLNQKFNYTGNVPSNIPVLSIEDIFKGEVGHNLDFFISAINPSLKNVIIAGVIFLGTTIVFGSAINHQKRKGAKHNLFTVLLSIICELLKFVFFVSIVAFAIWGFTGGFENGLGYDFISRLIITLKNYL